MLLNSLVATGQELITGMEIDNGSDNLLLNRFMNPPLKCKSFTTLVSRIN